MAEHRHHHRRHLQRRQFDYPLTHVYGGGFYTAPWDAGYYTAQNPHPADQCADTATCDVHAGDPTAGAAATAPSGDAGGTTGGTTT